MGVPSFNIWLVNKYPNVVVRAKEDVNTDTHMPNPNGIEFDNLYLDVNGIIHPCFHPEGDNEIEEDRLRKQFERKGKQVLPKQESELLDSNIITPGTEFMHELSMALQSYISSRIASNSWKDIMVILSDANVPGEGEHKIMSYICAQRNVPNYDPNTRHCLYGLDADLIMLALATHEPHFSILRDVLPEIFCCYCESYECKWLQFMHVWILREYLELDMKIEDPPENFKFDFEKIIDDLVFMCFFAGNDFLPKMPTLEINEGAIDLLMTVYKKEFKKLGGYLVDMSKIDEKKAAFVKLSRVEKFILMVGTYEEQIFRKRSEIRERKLRRLIRDLQDAEQDKEHCFSYNDNESSSDCALVIKKDMASNNSSPSYDELLQNTKDLKELLKSCIIEQNDLFKTGKFPHDKIKLGTTGWRQRYYKEKFSVEGSIDMESKRKDILQKYTEGLLWVLQYYYSGVPSWTWFYPDNYGPFASDLKGMGQVRVNFSVGKPFLPFDQLLSVLPPSSAHALPSAYSQLMLSEESNILDFYPLDFEFDTEGKRFMGQGICKLPFIDETRLLAETKELHKGLSENEASRNSVKVDTLIVRSNSILAEKICSLSREPNPYFKLNTCRSKDNGWIRSLCHECVGKPCDQLKFFDNLQEDYVPCLCYNLPRGSSQVPRLLSGVKLPEKTISDGDIMETILWHEKGTWNFNRHWGAQKFSPIAKNPVRRFSANSSSEVLHKDAGIGWGSGRGKTYNNTNMKRTDMVQNERLHQHEDSRPYHVNAIRDRRSQPYVENFRQVRISDASQSLRPNGGTQFPTSASGFTNQSGNVSHQGSHSGTMPYGRGQYGYNTSMSTQRSGSKVFHVKDQNRW
ncbi:hypothetical protein TanjilG_17074 [Lupinus angustifolius]|uniref:5'-3' exoribonuclease n=1 Tax=Lupinus angustifolius TaxID=3871 RepID=A0A4P1R0K3_LUPAN|nr:hypothetical protein TanjilG_17074 [Lupinus angustifolius]